MSRWMLMPAVLMVFAGVVEARLGETPAQCSARYGPVISESVDGKFTIHDYRKADILVRVYFVMKKEMIFAHKEAVAISYRKPSESETQSCPLQEEEISTLLGVNAQRGRWEKVDLVRKAAELNPGVEQSQVIRENNTFIVWKRPRGATAHYMKKTHELVIRLTPKVPLPVQTKMPVLLEGF